MGKINFEVKKELFKIEDDVLKLEFKLCKHCENEFINEISNELEKIRERLQDIIYEYRS